MILIAASMKVEIEGLFGLDRSSEYWEECRLEYTGIGRENVNKAIGSLEFDSNPEGLISVGFVGSVDPRVKPGDLCLIEAVGAPERTERFHPDKELWARAESSLEENFRVCKLLTVDNTAASSEEKRSLRTEEFSIVDRETYWVSEIADREEIPFLGLRVVIDGADQELPPEYCYHEDTGQVRPGKFAFWLVRNPSRVGGLPSLAWNSIKARRRLGRAVNSVVPALLGW